MALRVRFQHPTGVKLAISIERLVDGLLYDFGALAFSARPASPLGWLPEGAGMFAGQYKVTMATPASRFPDGDYVVTVHDGGDANRVVAELGATMHDGDDATVIPRTTPAVVAASPVP